MPRLTGFDSEGIPRVYAEDEFFQTALGFCREEAAAYIKQRPDTGPLSEWRYRDQTGDEYE